MENRDPERGRGPRGRTFNPSTILFGCILLFLAILVWFFIIMSNLTETASLVLFSYGMLLVIILIIIFFFYRGPLHRPLGGLALILLMSKSPLCLPSQNSCALLSTNF